MKTDLKIYLALYFAYGIIKFTDTEDGEEILGKLCTISSNEEYIEFNDKNFGTGLDDNPYQVKVDEIKLVLRKKEDMTEEEYKELFRQTEPERDLSKTYKEYMLQKEDIYTANVNHAIGVTTGWKYLLSIGIDLFDLIDQGLAYEALPTIADDIELLLANGKV